MIALMCSVEAEAERLLNAAVVKRSSTAGSKLLIEGTLGDRQVLLCVSGMGKVNAAHAATLLAQQKPDALIVFGIGGAYPSSGARVGDVALANEEIAGDEGVLTRDGFNDTEYIGIPLVSKSNPPRYNRFPAPEALLSRAQHSLSRTMRPAAVHTGPFITLSTCTGTTARAKELEQRYHGLCENMEGAAAAQVAELHGIPWLEVRGISNRVEDRDLKKWDIPRAAQAAQEATRHIVEGWNR